MKICNFRPLCFLALIVIITIVTNFVSPWLTVVFGVVLILILQHVAVPRDFKIAAVGLLAIVTVSFVLTTLLVDNPYYRTYQPNVGLRGVVLRYADWYLHCFLSDRNANLVLAMLFGNKTGLPFDLKQAFSVSGLAHLLAVSGLHVALLAAVISKIMHFLTLPRKWQVYVIAPILIFYAYLCGWQYSILRAVIMYLVYAFAKNYLYIADPLSTLSLAAIVILIMFPYALFSASFLLSFSCVLGIILFYDRFVKVCHIKPIAMYAAVTITSLPFTIHFFEYFPLYGLLANVVLVPILIFAFYMGMFAICTFGCGIVLLLVEPLLNLVCDVSAAIRLLPGAVLPISSSLPAAALYLAGLLILSRFIFLKPKVKYPLAILLFACYFMLVVV